MKGINFLSVPILLILGIFVCCCSTATVEFYSEPDFNGIVHTTTSSPSCKELSTAFNGSVRTTGCIIVFLYNNCDEEIWGFLVTSEERRLSELPQKYAETKGTTFEVNSFRDCTELEGRNEVDFDHYDKTNFEGEVTQFRNLCTNFPSSNLTSGMSVKLYGNCFKVYSAKNCPGVPAYTTHDTYFKNINVLRRSIEPCHPPQRQCEVRIAGNIYKLIHKADVFSQNYPQVPDTSIFLNNENSTIERIFEVSKEISETLNIQLSDVTRPMDTILIERELFFDKGITNSSDNSSVRKRVLSESLVHSPSNLNDTVLLNLERRIDINVQKNLTLPPCTKLEVMWLAEMTDEETDYEVYLKVGIEGSKPINVESIPFYFKGLNFYRKEDDITAIAKTTGKFLLSYSSNSWVNVSTEPIPSCRNEFIKLNATVINVSAITNVSDLPKRFQRVEMANQQIFINNGTTLHEKNYVAAKNITETGQLQFPEVINRMDSVVFDMDLQIDEEPSILFLTSVWDKIKRKEMTKDQNKLSKYDPLKFLVRSNKTYDVQEYIGVSACTQYDIKSFVQMAKDVQIEYKIELRVAGKFGLDLVEAEDIKEILDEFTVVRIEDNFTVVVETTGTMILNYGVGAGVNAEGTPIQECYERQAAFAGKCKFVCSA